MAESRSPALSLTQWSLGLAELPWDHPTAEDPVYEGWRNRDYSRPLFQRLDTVALSLLRKILSPAVSKRATIAQIRQHLWCRKSFKDKGEAAISKGYFKLMILFYFTIYVASWFCYLFYARVKEEEEKYVRSFPQVLL